MYRGSNPKILPIIIIIIVVALVIAAIVTLVSRLSGGDGASTTNQPEQQGTTLSEAVAATDASRSVRWTVRGPIVADENFTSYQITISPSQRTITTYKGYLDEVLSTRTLDNNEKAYSELTGALLLANIDRTRKVDDDNIRGVCATGGLVYMFEALNGSTAEHTVWTSSCKDSKGSMAADVPKIHALFVNQIPEFEPQFNKIY